MTRTRNALYRLLFYLVAILVLATAVAIRQRYDRTHPDPTGAPMGYACVECVAG